MALIVSKLYYFDFSAFGIATVFLNKVPLYIFIICSCSVWFIKNIKKHIIKLTNAYFLAFVSGLLYIDLYLYINYETDVYQLLYFSSYHVVQILNILESV